jgi:hypothetical protein
LGGLVGQVGLAVGARVLHLRVRGTAGDRLALELLGVVDLLALDLDRAVLAVPQ